MIDFFLSIEPYWNWNLRSCSLHPLRLALSIEPYWNWNRTKCPSMYSYPSLNRTILELKYFSMIGIVGINRTLNRTILELKFVMLIHVFSLLLLSIEPYWNWNFIKYLLSLYLIVSQSNHTGIEIKPDSWCSAFPSNSQSNHTGIEISNRFKSCPKNLSLNRTILELKFLTKFDCPILSSTLNRTILELKFHIYRFIRIGIIHSQSNHTGIEMSVCLG